MCGIAGMINFERNLSEEKYVIENMTSTLKNRGPDSYGYYISPEALLGHRRLVVVDPSGGIQPMQKTYNGKKYIIVYNGELYNTEEIRQRLKQLGFTFSSYSDTEVLLTSYIAWGTDCLKYMNGIFSFGIWNEKDKNLFLCRDPLGVKPLFYALKNKTLIFGSEIKTLLANPLIEPIINETGVAEIFGLGPAHSLDSGVFKDIYQLPPANFLLYSKDSLVIKEYWKLNCKSHTENLNTTTEHIRYLLIDSIERQLISDVPICTFLSGGLDSSIISAVASSNLKNANKTLNTYSIDYTDNNIYFNQSDFQPDSDTEWVKVMSKFLKSNHTNIILDSTNLAKALIEAVEACDLPGMADIDSSLYLFCKEVKKDSTVALSGECADEVFGGYPWFRKAELINTSTFPWSQSIEERKKLLSKEFATVDLEGYVKNQYIDTLKKVPKLDGESPFESRMRELFYLNMKWFMVTLLTRKDRMSMANSLEVRVPFADYRLVEYAFNIPIEMKFYNNREKGLLRKSMEGMLPKDVLWRKKSPYPKTFNPKYTNIVVNWLNNIIQDKTSPLLQLINEEEVKNLLASNGKSFNGRLFGQLMTFPQLVAYLIQINIWMKKYNVKMG